MSDTTHTGCSRKCWQGAAIAGAVLCLALKFAAGFGLIASLFLGLVIFAGLGTLLVKMVCTETVQTGTISTTVAAAKASAAAAPAAAAVAPTPQPDPTDLPAAEAQLQDAPDRAVVQPSAALPGEADLAARKGAWAYDAPTADATSAPVIKPSTPLAGEAELAARKGTWTYRP